MSDPQDPNALTHTNQNTEAQPLPSKPPAAPDHDAPAPVSPTAKPAPEQEQHPADQDIPDNRDDSQDPQNTEPDESAAATEQPASTDSMPDTAASEPGEKTEQNIPSAPAGQVSQPTVGSPDTAASQPGMAASEPSQEADPNNPPAPAVHNAGTTPPQQGDTTQTDGPAASRQGNTPSQAVPTSVQEGSRPMQEEAIPPLTSVYAAPKKNNTLILVFAGLAMVALICGTLIFMAASGSGTTTQGAVKYREERNFLVLSPVAVMDGAGASTSSGTLNPGQIVFIEETMSGSNGEVWGMISDQQWVLLSDPDYMYLIDEALVHYTTTTENKQYTALKDTYVYTIPGAISKPVSNVKKDDTLIVQEITTLDNSTWGRIGLNQWVLIDKDGTAILEVAEEAVSEDETDDKEEDEDKDPADTDEDDPESQPEESGKTISGFETGIYELDYAMVIRRSPSLEGDEVKTLPAGTLVRVAWLRKTSDGSIWGELDERNSGYWVCIRRNGITYMRWQDPDQPSVSTETQQPAVNPVPTPGTSTDDTTTTPPADAPSGGDNSEDDTTQNPSIVPDGPIVEDHPDTSTDPTAPAQAVQ